MADLLIGFGLTIVGSLVLAWFVGTVLRILGEGDDR